MNEASARSFVADLLTDHHSSRLRDLCDMTGDDPEELRHEVTDYVALIDLDAVAARIFAVAADGEHVLHEWADLEQIIAVTEQHHHPVSPVATPLDLPCPDWCDKPSGHLFETYPTTTRREHVHRFSDRGSGVTLEQIERSPDPSTGITDLGIDPGATVLRVQYGPRQVAYLTSAGAKRLAEQLVDGANMLDRVVPPEGP